MSKANILVVDDQESIRHFVSISGWLALRISFLVRTKAGLPMSQSSGPIRKIR